MNTLVNRSDDDRRIIRPPGDVLPDGDPRDDTILQRRSAYVAAGALSGLMPALSDIQLSLLRGRRPFGWANALLQRLRLSFIARRLHLID